MRLSTYANAPDIAGARSALAQLQLGVHGAVLYLDGGWRTIVSGLCAAARNAGAHVETSCAVAALEEDSVVIGDGRKLKASAIVLAVAPFEVARLTGHVTKLEPIRAACLDVALSHLFLQCFMQQDAKAIEELLAANVQSIHDSAGGEFIAAGIPVTGREKVALFYSRILPKEELRTRFTMLNGQPAVITERPDAPKGLAPRWIYTIDLDAEGKIRRSCTVFATEKLTAIPF